MKNLTPGMNYMKVEEICEILRVCKESGVRELSFRGLKVKLGRHANATYYHTAGTPQPSRDTIEAPQEINKADLAVKEEELSLLAIEDPLEYEALIARGELENIGGGHEEENY